MLMRSDTVDPCDDIEINGYMRETESVFNSFTAKCKSIVKDYFNIQDSKSFEKAKKIIDQKYLLTYGNMLNTKEKVNLSSDAAL